MKTSENDRLCKDVLLCFFTKNRKNFMKKSEKLSIMNRGTPMFFGQKSQKFHKKCVPFERCLTRMKIDDMRYVGASHLRPYDFPDFESDFWFSSNQQPFESTDSYANSMSLINVVSDSISILKTRDFYLK